jgi:hypothetical protein
MRKKTQAARVYILISLYDTVRSRFLESAVAIKLYKLLIQEDL